MYDKPSFHSTQFCLNFCREASKLIFASIPCRLMALSWCLLSLPKICLGAPLISREAPVGNGTVGFIPQDANRHTTSLLLSCILTLILCVYTAVHLNIVPKDEPSWRTFAREVWWCLIGLYGPELVVFTAWRQWSSAKALGAEIERTFKERKASEAPHWSLVHGFYAGMGGSAIETSTISPDEVSQAFPPRKRFSLTPRGVLLLAQCGHLPDVPKQVILDKSKVDTMAKLIVCLQAGWLLVQVVARLAAHLPVTLLEVNTVGHVTCALVMYTLWWHKPRQINEPTPLQGDWLAPIAAFMFISSRVSGEDPNSHLKTKIFSRPGPELSKLAYFPPFIVEADANGEVQIMSERRQESDLSISRTQRSGTGSFSYRPVYERQSTYKIEVIENTNFGRTESHEEQSRWSLATEAIARYPVIASRLRKPSTTTTHPGGDWLEGNIEDLLVNSASNWPGSELMRNVHSLVMGVVLWFVSMAYGAIHAAAWNDYFPTEAEKWLWRAAAIWMSASGLIWVFICLIANWFPRFDRFWVKFSQRKTPWWSYPTVYALCSICGIAYVLARVFLVVEAFVSIRKLPAASYDTPGWTQLVPHL